MFNLLKSTVSIDGFPVYIDRFLCCVLPGKSVFHAFQSRFPQMVPLFRIIQQGKDGRFQCIFVSRRNKDSRIADDFRQSMDKLVDQIVDSYTRTAQEAGHKDAWNRLGIVCAQYKRYAQAQRAFNTALGLDRNFLSAKINLGRVFELAFEDLVADAAQTSSVCWDP